MDYGDFSASNDAEADTFKCTLGHIPIYPVRFSIISEADEIAKVDDSTGKPPKVIPPELPTSIESIQDYSGDYVIRTLRQGYVYIYIDKVEAREGATSHNGYWRVFGYSGTAGAYPEDPPELGHESPPGDVGHRGFSKYNWKGPYGRDGWSFTDEHKPYCWVPVWASTIWIAYSEERWTSNHFRKMSQGGAETREKIMQKVELRGKNDWAAFKGKITELVEEFKPEMVESKLDKDTLKKAELREEQLKMSPEGFERLGIGKLELPGGDTADNKCVALVSLFDPVGDMRTILYRLNVLNHNIGIYHKLNVYPLSTGLICKSISGSLFDREADVSADGFRAMGSGVRKMASEIGRASPFGIELDAPGRMGLGPKLYPDKNLACEGVKEFGGGIGQQWDELKKVSDNALKTGWEDKYDELNEPLIRWQRLIDIYGEWARFMIADQKSYSYGMHLKFSSDEADEAREKIEASDAPDADSIASLCYFFHTLGIALTTLACTKKGNDEIGKGLIEENSDLYTYLNRFRNVATIFKHPYSLLRHTFYQTYGIAFMPISGQVGMLLGYNDEFAKAGKTYPHKEKADLWSKHVYDVNDLDNGKPLKTKKAEAKRTKKLRARYGVRFQELQQLFELLNEVNDQGNKKGNVKDQRIVVFDKDGNKIDLGLGDEKKFAALDSEVKEGFEKKRKTARLNDRHRWFLNVQIEIFVLDADGKFVLDANKEKKKILKKIAIEYEGNTSAIIEKRKLNIRFAGFALLSSAYALAGSLYAIFNKEEMTNPYGYGSLYGHKAKQIVTVFYEATWTAEAIQTLVNEMLHAPNKPGSIRVTALGDASERIARMSGSKPAKGIADSSKAKLRATRLLYFNVAASLLLAITGIMDLSQALKEDNLTKAFAATLTFFAGVLMGVTAAGSLSGLFAISAVVGPWLVALGVILMLFSAVITSVMYSDLELLLERTFWGSDDEYWGKEMITDFDHEAKSYRTTTSISPRLAIDGQIHLAKDLGGTEKNKHRYVTTTPPNSFKTHILSKNIQITADEMKQFFEDEMALLEEITWAAEIKPFKTEGDKHYVTITTPVLRENDETFVSVKVEGHDGQKEKECIPFTSNWDDIEHEKEHEPKSGYMTVSFDYSYYKHIFASNTVEDKITRIRIIVEVTGPKSKLSRPSTQEFDITQLGLVPPKK